MGPAMASRERLMRRESEWAVWHGALGIEHRTRRGCPGRPYLGSNPSSVTTRSPRMISSAFRQQGLQRDCLTLALALAAVLVTGAEPLAESTRSIVLGNPERASTRTPAW